MKIEDKERQIKIKCPEHEVVFEVENKPKIICEIKEHSISNNFPKSEYWEYCCDCQTFSRSTLDVGGSAKELCFNCERKTLSRFICGNCKIIAFDSGKDTKGKVFSVSFDSKKINPSCPGCFEQTELDEMFLHKCKETDSVFLTPRKICPFCKKETSPKKEPSTKPITESKCPNCNSTNPKDAPFCGNCGKQLLTNISNIKFGTTQAKTKLLGSICPNCGNPNKLNSLFCTKCGQKLKETKKEQKTEEMVGVPPSLLGSTQDNSLGATNGTKTPQKSKSSTNASGCLAAVGVIVGVIILCVVFNAITTKNRQVSTRNDNTYNQSSNNDSTTKLDESKNEDVIDTSSNDMNETEVYTGRIGKNNTFMSFKLELKQDGDKLSGVATTSNSSGQIKSRDFLEGKFTSGSRFLLDAYEDKNQDGYKDYDENKTGEFRGNKNSNGLITGNWIGDGKRIPFSATKQ